jgi:phospho-N-acetylmuramoyl-pentapeptide-transferase
MLYYLARWLLEAAKDTDWEQRLSVLRLFNYITFRTAGAAITALLLTLWVGPAVIEWLKRFKFGQEYDDVAHQTGDLKTRLLSKKGTPTMGGILIIGVLDVTALLWTQWNPLVLLTLLAVAVLCGLGFYDDYMKIAKQNAGGAAETVKLVVQFALALFVGIYLWKLPELSYLVDPVTFRLVEKNNLVSTLLLPFYKYPIFIGGIAGVVLIAFTIVGSSNAVNLTDGLDGLAIGCTLIVSVAFLFLTYFAGHARISAYLQTPYVPGAGELTVICAAMIGAGLGFLWFNCHPAQVFMGDTGSLPLGGALGIIAVLIHQPFVLVIAGGVFVAEAVSVLMQRGWFKFTRIQSGEGRRIFLMAPLHHHFEKKGWYESQVVIRFYILSILCAVVALSTLKIR